jgi:hypothetical protein
MAATLLRTGCRANATDIIDPTELVANQSSRFSDSGLLESPRSVEYS